MRALAGWVLAALLVTGFVGVASSQDEPQTRASLVGLEGVRVYVEELQPEIQAEGLTSGSLEQDAKEELKAGGVPLLSEGIQGSGEPYLYVYLHVFRLPTQTRRYLFYIRVELNQQVSLQRDPRIVGPAVTWSDGGGWARLLPGEHPGNSEAASAKVRDSLQHGQPQEIHLPVSVITPAGRILCLPCLPGPPGSPPGSR